ncbi:hypothetical protein [Lysinibacillus xylanilyticus]|uniref:hypothetical protein n=1 Tax=Lysinibacillus xylanilyticus TaxID=582475 RepID=UPI00083C93B7|nr:hypothetical protein [Lysinibacillus xylanilyticus]
MIANTILSRDNGIQEYISLIDDSKMIEPMAKEILYKNPFAWANIITKAFDVTVKGNSISINSFTTFLEGCAFEKFLEILEEHEIILTIEKGMLIFFGNGDLETILLDALSTNKFL